MSDGIPEQYRRKALGMVGWFTRDDLYHACAGLSIDDENKHWNRVRNAISQQRDRFEKKKGRRNTFMYRALPPRKVWDNPGDESSAKS